MKKIGGFLLVSLAMVAAANSQTYDNTFNGAVDNKWNTVGNWSTGSLPGSADSVSINYGENKSGKVELENDITVGVHILFVESRHDFFERGLVLKPQHDVGSFAVFADARCGLANAERARAAAAIREVDVESNVDGVDDGFGFEHSELLST